MRAANHAAILLSGQRGRSSRHPLFPLTFGDQKVGTSHEQITFIDELTRLYRGSLSERCLKQRARLCRRDDWILRLCLTLIEGATYSASYRAVSSVVEHRSYTPRATGSKPVPPTKQFNSSPALQTSNSVVESRQPGTTFLQSSSISVYTRVRCLALSTC